MTRAASRKFGRAHSNAVLCCVNANGVAQRCTHRIVPATNSISIKISDRLNTVVRALSACFARVENIDASIWRQGPPIEDQVKPRKEEKS
jgi:hypothetical protein